MSRPTKWRRLTGGTHTVLPPPHGLVEPPAPLAASPQGGASPPPQGLVVRQAPVAASSRVGAPASSEVGSPLLTLEHRRALGLEPALSLLPTARPQLMAGPGPAGSATACSHPAALPPQLAPRRDAPTVRFTAGSRAAFSDVVLDPAVKEAMLKELDDDVLAQSAAASSASVLRTWVKFHRAWFPHTPAFPTWPAAVRAVAAQMKKKGYRSWANYLSRAKREHIQAGGVWDQVLDYTAKECTRSVTRGLGPPRQSAPLDIKAVAAVHLSVAPLCEGGPMNPKALIILGSFFLAREIEISLALCRNVHILVGPVVCWVLPASKTDPAANTVTREWG